VINRFEGSSSAREGEEIMSVKKPYIAIVALLMCVGPAVAQQTADPALTRPADRTQRTANYHGEVVSNSAVHRASEIIGLNVMSPDNENTIGEIDDLVLDAQTGKIRYAAVSVGGFLGIGEKMVAVPWQAFEQRRDEDGDLYISLNTTKEKLEKAPGFNKDKWPDFANPQWSTDNDRHYGVSVNINTAR
jgi:sporulation protein YlmC with PRC-barrel domain